ncbi:MAG TPA: translation initiation factor IF-2 subunit alpha [Candidatus Nitrosotenuis sp.]|nr:translation initiation factor IF-2 subunit alpha [Candidatus Nitrosotenuis sp.]HII03409.1 translation initiation factor IF-2 subunit alpha [Candidatus Nitrosotenuis sp.]
MVTETQELPETGEIVLATITKLTDHGAYVTLDEYNNTQGFLHVSEIAPGWVRSVNKFVREGEKKVLLVKKVNPGRSEIDLSLKQVSKEQQKKKLLEVKRIEKGRTLLDVVKTSAGLSDKELEKLEDTIFSKYDFIYDAFLDVATKGIGVLDDLKLVKKISTSIAEAGSKIKPPSVEIRGICDLSCNQSNGVDIIKNAILESIGNQSSNIFVTYIGAPKYRLSVTGPDFKTAERMLKPVLDNIQKMIEKNNGTFNFTREESKKTREG